MECGASGETFSFGTINLQEHIGLHTSHEDKYDQDYVPPEPINPIYSR
jgi:hypothetical protein